MSGSPAKAVTAKRAMHEVFSEKLSDRDFSRVARLVEETVGIHLPGHKRSMVELRLGRRVRALGMSSLKEYCAQVFDAGPGGTEALCLFDTLTTNKTDFFREAEHFHVLTERVIPDLRAMDPGMGVQRAFQVWSAGCASGEEPYSTAMVLADYAERHQPFSFTVHATDVSHRVLATGRCAVYPEERACAVPFEMRRRYLLRNKDHAARLVRVAPEIRAHVRFSRHNLLSAAPPGDERFDVVLCRNVIIYFERDTQVRVLENLARSLRPGGYLFVGHSEALHGMSLPLEHVGPTLYRKR